MRDPRTISEQLSDHVVGLRYEDIPTPVVERTKELLANHIGVAFRGHASDRGQRMVRLALDLTGSGGPCTIVGAPHTVDPLEAVFANAVLMTGMDDILPTGAGRGVGVHPGAIVQPTAWAVGETANASGRELLTAVVVGYDLIGRLGKDVETWNLEVPRNKSHVVGPFGAAATTARLLGLSRQQTTHALGHAGHAAMGIAEGTGHLWTIYALLARNGVLAAKLAEAELPATPTIVEGRHGVYRSFFFRDVPDSFEECLATMGSEFEVSYAQTKHHLASGSNLIPLELVQQLATTLRLKPRDLAGIDVVLPVEREPREAIREAALSSSEDRATSQTRSLRFRIAMIVTDGTTDPARMERPPDAELQAVLDKVRLRFADGLPSRFARIEMTTTSGRQHVTEGDFYDPPAVDEFDWMVEGGRTLLPAERLHRLKELLQRLEDVSDVSEVMACAVPRTRSPSPDHGTRDVEKALEQGR